MCPFDRKMKHHDEFRAEPGVYFLYNKHGLVLYVGTANNPRVRLAKHEADHDVVRPWIFFLDQQCERLNIRTRKAVQRTDVTSFDTISRGIGWPLAIIESKQAIDCCYDTLESIRSDRCSSEELDLEEFNTSARSSRRSTINTMVKSLSLTGGNTLARNTSSPKRCRTCSHTMLEGLRCERLEKIEERA